MGLREGLLAVAKSAEVHGILPSFPIPLVGSMVRILSLRSADGPTHMSTDEALLAVGTAPVLRLYTWQPAAVSLGYFQDHEAIRASLPHPMPMVRRITGGGAIWHDDEITYCLVARSGVDVPERSSDLYGLIHGQIAEALRSAGAPLERQPTSVGDRRYRSEPRCFASPASDDLVHPDGGKVLGSAARNRNGRVLLHGSLKLAGNPWDLDASRGCGLPADQAAAALEQGLIAALRTHAGGDLPIREDELTPAETAERDRLLDVRYGDEGWVRRREGPRP